MSNIVSQFECSENGLKSVLRLKTALQYRFPDIRVSAPQNSFITLLLRTATKGHDKQYDDKMLRFRRDKAGLGYEDDAAMLYWCIALSADCLEQSNHTSNGSTRHNSGVRPLEHRDNLARERQNFLSDVTMEVSFFCESRHELNIALKDGEFGVILDVYDLFQVFVIAHQPEVELHDSSSASSRDTSSCTARTAVSIFTKGSRVGVDEFSSAVKYMRTRLTKGIPFTISAASACEQKKCEKQRIKLPAAIVLLESVSSGAEYSLADIIVKILVYAFEGLTVDIEFNDKLLPKYLSNTQDQVEPVQHTNAQQTQVPPHKMVKFIRLQSTRSTTLQSSSYAHSYLSLLTLYGPSDMVRKGHAYVRKLCDELLEHASLRCDNCRRLPGDKSSRESSSMKTDESMRNKEFHSLRAILALGYGGISQYTNDSELARLVKLRKTSARVAREWLEWMITSNSTINNGYQQERLKNREDGNDADGVSHDQMSPTGRIATNKSCKEENASALNAVKEKTKRRRPTVSQRKKGTTSSSTEGSDSSDTSGMHPSRKNHRRRPHRNARKSSSESSESTGGLDSRSSNESDTDHYKRRRRPQKQHRRNSDYSDAEYVQVSKEIMQNIQVNNKSGDKQERSGELSKHARLKRDTRPRHHYRDRHRRHIRSKSSSMSTSARNDTSPRLPESRRDRSVIRTVADRSAYHTVADHTVLSDDRHCSPTPHRKLRDQNVETKPAEQESVQHRKRVSNVPARRQEATAIDTGVTTSIANQNREELRRQSNAVVLRRNTQQQGPVTNPLEKPHCTNKIWYTHGTTTLSVGYAPPDGYRMRTIVLDGQNIACLGRQKRNWANVRRLATWFKSIPTETFEQKIVIPKRVLDDSLAQRDMELELMREEFEVIATPGGRCGNREYVCYDDHAVVQIAKRDNACIISNDRYRDLITADPSLKDFIEQQQLAVRMDGAEFVFVFRGKVKRMVDTPFWVKN
eukprot:Lankesteria_metandrocarpae@DN6074_c0_g1_i1.p1